MFKKLLTRWQKFCDRERFAVGVSGLVVVLYGFVALASLLLLLLKPVPLFLVDLLKIWVGPFSSLAAYALRRVWQMSPRGSSEDKEQDSSC